MSDTFERACRAICQSRKFETGEGTCAPRCMEQLGDARDKCAHVVLIHGDLVRHVINAIREPTDEMIDAGVNARAQFFNKQGFSDTGPRIVLVANHPAGTIYQAMIDQLLKV